MPVELSEVISEVAAILFNKSLTTAEIPNDCKLENVTPVIKKGSKSIPANYRPISLTRCLVKCCLLRSELVRNCPLLQIS